MIVKLENLPKISLNAWYGGGHWSKRKKIKDSYKTIVKSQFKHVLPKDKQYKVYYAFEFKTRALVEYHFTFKSRPLDASNCVAMVKLIEDVIFEDDSYKIVKEIRVSSNKGLKDNVSIHIKEI